ncbi:MAG: S-layer protein [Methanoregulaceae archaeon]|jgi:hypothetical protein
MKTVHRNFKEISTDKKGFDIALVTRIALFAFFIIGILVLSGMVGPASATSEPIVGNEPTVTITAYTVTPQVMMPNDQGTITVTIKNTATTATQQQSSGSVSSNTLQESKQIDINVFIENIKLEGNGIKVLSNEFDRVGDLGPGQSTTITFAIQAPEKTGMYFPEVWIDTQGGRSTRYPIPVNVNTQVATQHQPVVIMESTLPETVTPGDEFPVGLTFFNLGQSAVSDITVMIGNAGSSIAPKLTDTLHVGALSPGEQSTLNTVFISDKKATSGVIKIPVTIKFSSIDGVQQSQNSTIDVNLKGVAEMGIVSIDSTPQRLTENIPFDLTVRIENTGTGDAKAVSATIDLPTQGTKEAFIGKITPGNDAPALFLLESLRAGNYPYTLNITYTDDTGIHTQNRQLNLHVSGGNGSGTVILGVLGIGILAFCAYWFWYLPKKNGAKSFPWIKKD